MRFFCSTATQKPLSFTLVLPSALHSVNERLIFASRTEALPRTNRAVSSTDAVVKNDAAPKEQKDEPNPRDGL